MKQHTFSPGARVSDQGNGRQGTVADDPAMAAEYPGMIPVHWDGGTRSVAHPSILEPVAAPAVSREAAPSSLDAAVAVLRARPELTTNETTVNALIRAAIDAGLRPSVLLEAQGIVTGNKL